MVHKRHVLTLLMGLGPIFHVVPEGTWIPFRDPRAHLTQLNSDRESRQCPIQSSVMALVVLEKRVSARESVQAELEVLRAVSLPRQCLNDKETRQRPWMGQNLSTKSQG